MPDVWEIAPSKAPAWAGPNRQEAAMTWDDALRHMISIPARPWRDRRAFYASRMTREDFDFLERRVQPAENFTTHDIVHNAGALLAAASLAQTGKILWAPADWMGHMAEALRVNRRTVERWASGQTEPPEGVWADLREIAKKRAAEILALTGDEESLLSPRVEPLP